jgi:hypothetical protein
MRHRQEAVLFPRRYRLKNGKRIVVWWYYVTTDGGKRLRFSLATSSRTEARYLLDQKIKGGSSSQSSQQSFDSRTLPGTSGSGTGAPTSKAGS